MAGSLSALAALPAAASAQARTEPDLAPAEARADAPTDQTIIVTGTRRDERTVPEPMIPTDLFTSQDLLRQGTSDTDALFQNVIPSFSVPQAAIQGDTSFVRPPNVARVLRRG